MCQGQIKQESKWEARINEAFALLAVCMLVNLHEYTDTDFF